MNEPLLSVEDVAQRLGVRPSTVRAGVKRGLIPAVVLWRGKRRSLVRFRSQDIERLIRERTVCASPSAAVVWSLCDGERTCAQIKQLISDAYPQSPGVHLDVDDALARFVAEGAIEPG